jgi:NAD(P)-dependent dehydrogenase (short-subunit alcohol dehydrogenase family)
MVANVGIGRLETIVDCNGLSPLTRLVITLNLFIALIEDWDRLFAVIAKGTFLCYKYAALQMIKQGRGGRIIGASLSGKQGEHAVARELELTRAVLTGSTNISVYCRIKFTIRGFTRAAGMYVFRLISVTPVAYSAKPWNLVNMVLQ